MPRATRRECPRPPRPPRSTGPTSCGLGARRVRYTSGECLGGRPQEVRPDLSGRAPSFGLAGGWIAADLFIQGLEVAGKNPTRASYISGLQGVTAYTAGGLLPTPRNFGLAYFGQLPAQNCEYYVRQRAQLSHPKARSAGPSFPTPTRNHSGPTDRVNGFVPGI